jgi:hypothetical protein
MSTATPGRERVRTRRLGRIVLGIIGVLVAVYGLLSAGFYWAMLQTPDRFGRIMAHVPIPLMIALPFAPMWKQARAGHVHPGDTAPDFNLPTLDHSGRVQLASFRGSRPVVLVFGSYT